MYLESSNQNMIKRDKILVFYISKNRETLSIGENRNQKKETGERKKMDKRQEILKK